ncbi:unnamed protein product [Cylicocyclus nassatus]|uniref:Uncharacterized protein n=1 Tax=Cylicocyclus nassatus TaxID=53992 RepID=A0AA36GNC3_CYLNA|nr:unnamed protein product [Cylicocyclus nassatus]
MWIFFLLWLLLLQVQAQQEVQLPTEEQQLFALLTFLPDVEPLVPPPEPPGPWRPRPPGPRDGCSKWGQWQQVTCWWPDQPLSSLAPACANTPNRTRFPDYVNKLIQAKSEERYAMIVDEYTRRGKPPKCGYCSRSFECRARNDTESRHPCSLKEVREIQRTCDDSKPCELSLEHGGCPSPAFLGNGRAGKLQKLLGRGMFEDFALQFYDLSGIDVMSTKFNRKRSYDDSENSVWNDFDIVEDDDNDDADRRIDFREDWPSEPRIRERSSPFGPEQDERDDWPLKKEDRNRESEETSMFPRGRPFQPGPSPFHPPQPLPFGFNGPFHPEHYGEPGPHRRRPPGFGFGPQRGASFFRTGPFVFGGMRGPPPFGPERARRQPPFFGLVDGPLSPPPSPRGLRGDDWPRPPPPSGSNDERPPPPPLPPGPRREGHHLPPPPPPDNEMFYPPPPTRRIRNGDWHPPPPPPPGPRASLQDIDDTYPEDTFRMRRDSFSAFFGAPFYDERNELYNFIQRRWRRSISGQLGDWNAFLNNFLVSNTTDSNQMMAKGKGRLPKPRRNKKPQLSTDETLNMLSELLYGTTCVSSGGKCLCCCGSHVPNLLRGTCEDIRSIMPGIDSAYQELSKPRRKQG